MRDRMRQLAARWKGQPPAPAPAPALRSATFHGEHGTLDHRVYVPGGRARSPRGLVVMLHGGTQTPEDFAAGTRMNEHAERLGFVVVYPEHAGNGRLWDWSRPADQQREGGEPALIAGLTRHVMTAERITPGKVFVAGLSAGGAMAATMAATHPELYAAAGVHSGLAHGAARNRYSALRVMMAGPGLLDLEVAEPSSPVIVFHGDRDRTVVPANADRVVSQVAGAHAATADPPVSGRATVASTGEPGRAWTRTVHRDPTGRAVVEDWRIHDGPHGWAGGSPEGTFTDPAGPDASAEMLRFFAQIRTGQPLPA